jgi:predicted phage-related endonuclease
MIEFHKIESRDQWLAMRAMDLTASDVGAAVGVDPYKSRLGLYAEKTAMLMPQADNNAMRRGRWLEAAVLSAIREENPDWDVQPLGYYVRDPDLRLGATPDATAATDEIGLTNIQCKVVNRPSYNRDWVDGPPMNYLLQTLTEGMLLGAHRSIVAALVIDTYTADLFLHPVPRHEAAEARVRAIAAQFWEDVAAGRMPPADEARDAETVAALYPQSEAETVLDLSTDNMIRDLLRERSTAKAVIKVEEQRVGEIDTLIKEKLGTNERAELPGWKISWKTQNLKERIVAATTSRPLRVTEIEA